MLKALVLAAPLLSGALANILFKEDFSSGWENHWVKSTAKGEDQGEWKWSAGKWYNDAEADKGLQTGENSKFYGISAALPEPFSNENKDLVIQYQVKHEQKIDCGGGYIKLFDSSLDQKQLHGETPYNIMFGPDICGSTKRVHVIFTYKGKNLLRRTDIRPKDDALSHVYTLVVKPDNSYRVLVDLEEVANGELEEDWDFLLPKEIDDKDDKRPEDWDERARIPDPEDVKPEGYDDVPQFIQDTDATKPDDWDTDDDGEWEVPMKDNPAYNGPWSPTMIDNPAYKGKWAPRKIPNPDYSPDSNLYLYKDNAFVGIDLWQVKAGTIFDHILITDDEEEALEYGKSTWGAMHTGEEEMKKHVEEEEEREATAKAAEAAKAAKPDDSSDDSSDEEQVPKAEFEKDEL